MSKVKTVRDVVKSMRIFITLVLIGGPLLGVLSAIGYRWIVATYGTWDISKDSFHFGIILYGLGFTFPILAISCRLMVKMFFQNCEQIENQNFIIEKFRNVEEKAGPVIDKIEEIVTEKAEPIINKIEMVIEKAVPIAENVEEIVKRANRMAEDIETIAHKVRTVTEALNGHLDFKNIEGKLDKVADSLSTIADVFEPVKRREGGNKKAEVAEVMLPAFDPIKAGGRR